jgi:hypothetical protein
MKKLTLAFALLLTTAAAAHAQVSTNNPTGITSNNPTSDDGVRNAMRLGDEAAKGEAMISASRSANVRIVDEANRAVPRGRSGPRPGEFNADINVTNSAAKTIKAVAWTATLVDHETGAVIRSYDVTTKTKIAPGKTKKLSKRLTTPGAQVVRANSQTPKRQVADLKVTVTGVTYADGSTSTTP